MNQQMLNRLRRIEDAKDDDAIGPAVIITVRDTHRDEDYATEVARLEREGRRITDRTPVILLRRFSAEGLA